MPLVLPHPFVIAEDEGAVFDDRPASRCAELVSAEWRYWGSRIVEKIPGVQRTIAKKLISGTMELIGPGFGDGIHDAASRPAVLRTLVRGDNREFLNGIDAQLLARYATGRGIGVAVHGDAVQAVVVHLGPRTRN